MKPLQDKGPNRPPGGLRGPGAGLLLTLAIWPAGGAPAAEAAASGLELVDVPAGVVVMGDDAGEADGFQIGIEHD